MNSISRNDIAAMSIVATIVLGAITAIALAVIFAPPFFATALLAGCAVYVAAGCGGSALIMFAASILLLRKRAENNNHLACGTSNASLANDATSAHKVIELPNFTTIHVNEHGEVFYLTPIGGNNIDQYNSQNLDDYTKACIDLALESAYDENRHLKVPVYDEGGTKIVGEKIVSCSIAEKIEDLEADEHIVNLWIQACHFIIVRSNQGRFWLLHYDPAQSRYQSNRIDGAIYPRPNYSDLRPLLPYNLEGVALRDDEKVQVVVIHPSKGYDIDDENNLSNGQFDSAVFSKFVGKDNVVSFKTICYRDFLTDSVETPIEIDFNIREESLTIFLKNQRDVPLFRTENLF